MPKLPPWIQASSYNNDDFARACEELQGAEYLYTGKQPKKDMRVFLHVDYEDEDGREQHARMMGIVTHIFNAPPVGAYAVYADEQEPPGESVRQPPLPGTEGSVFEKHSRLDVIKKLGAVHGQRVSVELAVPPDEAEQHPRLAGIWKGVLVANDNMAHIWCLDSIMPAEVAARAEKRKREYAAAASASSPGVATASVSAPASAPVAAAAPADAVAKKPQLAPDAALLAPVRVNAAPDVAPEPEPARGGTAALGLLIDYGSDDDDVDDDGDGGEKGDA